MRTVVEDGATLEVHNVLSAGDMRSAVGCRNEFSDERREIEPPDLAAIYCS